MTFCWAAAGGNGKSSATTKRKRVQRIRAASYLNVVRGPRLAEKRTGCRFANTTNPRACSHCLDHHRLRREGKGGRRWRRRQEHAGDRLDLVADESRLTGRQ